MNQEQHQDSTSILDVRDVSLAYGGQDGLAVNRVSFNIKRGHTLGLVGASGAGKSSIARMLMQLTRPSAGDILFNGISLFQSSDSQRSQIQQDIQFVFQEPSASLSPRRKVGRTLLEPLAHFGIGNKAERLEKIYRTLDMVGLGTDVLERYPHQFSSGQQQRIAIARALVTDPQLLVADEAVSSLDVSIQAQILQLLQAVKKELGITMLFISHDLAVIRQLADEVAVMNEGQMLEHCVADDFFSSPSHPYSRSLLSFARQNAVPSRKMSPV